MLFLFCLSFCLVRLFVFFFNDPATTEIYTLSLHDALPICVVTRRIRFTYTARDFQFSELWEDRKSTRLNSSHLGISYAVFCLKKKKTHLLTRTRAQHESHFNITRTDPDRDLTVPLPLDTHL